MTERRFYTRSATALIATLVTLGGLIGCADTASVVRKFTYPPDFKYISQGELRSGMATLALHLERLDNALAPNDPARPVDQAEVRQILADIQHTARSLEAGEVGSNHPVLEDQMSVFTSNIEQARFAASLNPPRYYLAGRVAGACVNCHRIER